MEHMNIYPLAVAIVGLVVYGLTDGKASEMGRICFAFGLLAFLFSMQPVVIR